jgi:hypothetical protein
MALKAYRSRRNFDAPEPKGVISTERFTVMDRWNDQPGVSPTAILVSGISNGVK